MDGDFDLSHLITKKRKAEPEPIPLPEPEIEVEEDDFVLNIGPSKIKKVQKVTAVKEIKNESENAKDATYGCFPLLVNVALYENAVWNPMETVVVETEDDEDEEHDPNKKILYKVSKESNGSPIGWCNELQSQLLGELLNSVSAYSCLFKMNLARKQTSGIYHTFHVYISGPNNSSGFYDICSLLDKYGIIWTSVAKEFESLRIARQEEIAAKNYVAPTAKESQNYHGTSTVSLKKIETEFLQIFSSSMSHPDELKKIEPAWIIKPNLFPYQKQGLAWMIGRESGEVGAKKKSKKIAKDDSDSDDEDDVAHCYGGILGDDMGLGKTLQIISLIATNSADEPLRDKRPLKTIGPTLIVCPLSVIKSWTDQLEAHLEKRSLSYMVHHGKERAKSGDQLSDYDVVVTTYDTVSNEWKPDKTDAEAVEEDLDEEAEVLQTSPLFDVDWLRIVLDEGHKIKNRKTKSCKSVCALKSKRRWAVTGTFIQNEIDDLYSLFKFLRLKPIDSYDTWKEHIVRPLKDSNGKGMERLQSILSTMCIRRTKDGVDKSGKRILNLKEKRIRMEYVEFDDEERAVYERIEVAGKKTVQNFLKKNSMKKNFTHVLEMLLRLRQCCNHLKLLPEKYLQENVEFEETSSELKLAKELLAEQNQAECQKCENDTSNPMITECGHFFCPDCIEPFASIQNPLCPMCQAVIRPNSIIEGASFLQPKYSKIPNNTKPSSKIRALITLLKQHRMEPNHGKVIVFSQWTRMLDIIAVALDNAGFRHVRIDGSLTHKTRIGNIEEFRNDASTEIMLISLGAGSLGLNLTVANKVILIDPWWNPQVEAQAIDRVHRVGQSREVEIIRFAIKNSAEDRVLALQAKKLELLNATLSGANMKALEKELHMDLIKDIFHINQKADRPIVSAVGLPTANNTPQHPMFQMTNYSNTNNNPPNTNPNQFNPYLKSSNQSGAYPARPYQ